MQLLLDLNAMRSECIYGSCYSYNKLQLLKHITITHIILYSINQLRNNNKFVKIVLEKQNMLINSIKNFEIYPGKWLYPKKFCEHLIKIIEK